jgi:hypothetical protein
MGCMSNTTSRPAAIKSLNLRLAALSEETREVLSSDRSAWVKEAMLRAIAVSQRAVSADLARLGA